VPEDLQFLNSFLRRSFGACREAFGLTLQRELQPLEQFSKHSDSGDEYRLFLGNGRGFQPTQVSFFSR